MSMEELNKKINMSSVISTLDDLTIQEKKIKIVFTRYLQSYFQCVIY